MKAIINLIRRLVLTLLALTSFAASTLAQEVFIPDPDLNDAIRAALQKPTGPLTEEDLLSLTNLNACCGNVSNREGLEAARNLIRLSLDRNQLTNFFLPGTFTNLSALDLSFNSLTNVSLPSGLTNLTTLLIQGNLLTNFNLPEGLTALERLNLDDNRLTSFTLPAGLMNLKNLNLAENQLTGLALPAGMTNLADLLLF